MQNEEKIILFVLHSEFLTSALSAYFFAFFLTGRPAFFLSPPPSGGADASIGSFFAMLL